MSAPLVYLGSIVQSLNAASSGVVNIESSIGCWARQVVVQADMRTSGSYLVGLKMAKNATNDLTFDTSASTISNLGADDDGARIAGSSSLKYLKWCVANGTTAANGGANDRLLVKCYG